MSLARYRNEGKPLKKLKFQAIIFDLDGTLLNTLSDLGNAANRVLTKHAFPTHILDAYRFFVGDGARMLITRALPPQGRDESTINACLDEFLEDYEQNADIETDLYGGIAEMLDNLSELGIKLAVLSNKPHELTIECINNYFSKWKFERILGQKDTIPKKPDPAGALRIARQMGLPVSSFLYLGDSGVDMKTAVSSGMFPAGALWGFRTETELKDNGARALLNHPADLFDLIG